MNKKFLLIQSLIQNQFNENLRQKINTEHLIYKKINKFLENKNYVNIGFLHTYQDDYSCYASMDDLIKQDINVFISEYKNKKLMFNKVNNIYKNIENKDGYIKYRQKEYLKQKLDIVFVNVQGYKDNKGLLFETKFISFLKKFGGEKIGYTSKNNLIENSYDELLIELDRIIVV